MTKDDMLEDMDEEELEMALDRNQEDLTADVSTDETNSAEDTVIYKDREPKISVDLSAKGVEDYVTEVLEEVPQLSIKEKKKQEKLEAREKKILAKRKARMIKTHRKSIKKNPDKLIRYNTDPSKGLSNEIVEKRLLDDLTNTTNNTTSKSILSILRTNILTFFNVLLIAIGVILISVGAYTDIIFLVIVFLNTVIGIIQEVKAKNTIDKLSLISAPTAIVRRSGINKEVAVGEIVLDDIVLLDSGMQICADSIVVDGQIEVNESLLTGESDSVIKKHGDILYSGSFVVSGSCAARVDKIGADNYIEQLAGQAKKFKKVKSELLKSLNFLIQFMAFVVIIMGALLFCVMFILNDLGIVLSIRRTAGAMIGMIPSGLFLMTSMALAVGVIRLGQKNVLVKELYCIEMLARVNCICLDKTGTITDGTMSVKNVVDYNIVKGLATKNVISAILNALHDQNMTSKALEQRFGLGKRIKSLAAIPFSSQRKYQAVTFDKYGTYILGAPEFVLKENYNVVKNDVEKYANLGYRVLCLAHKEGIIVDGELPTTIAEVVSMILIEDNIRPDAIKTIKYFKDSDVEVKVISGDNPITVSKIAQRAGIDNSEDYISLDGVSDTDVIKAATKYTVFGRVSPAQKRLLVQTLKEAEKTVAMTGDGVNDILALKEADCSIAVASGSEAARNVSNLVLMDSNFDSMPSVVAEGRRVINNVTSVASLFLTKTIFSFLLALQALQTGVYPISTNQLILIDVFCIGIPSLFLVMEPNNNNVQGKFLFNVFKKALPGAIVILIIATISFAMSDNFNFDNITISTIIVIAATHTCLMVLIKTCKPFNAMRRALCTFCYGAFLFVITLLPQLLEFRPIFGFFEYYSPNLVTERITSYPSIEISDDSYFIFDGVVTDYYCNPTSTSISISSVLDTNDGKYYYTLNGTKTNYEVNIPKISYLNNGTLAFNGFLLDDCRYEADFESKIFIDSEGYVHYCDSAEEMTENNRITTTLTTSNTYYGFENLYGASNTKKVHYQILPTVEIRNGEFIINNQASTAIRYQTTISADEGFSVSIEPSTMDLLINGKPIYATLADGSISEVPYKVSMPTVSYTLDGNVYFDGCTTQLSIEEIYGTVYDSEGIPKTDYNIGNNFEGCFDAEKNKINPAELTTIPNDGAYRINKGGVYYASGVGLSNSTVGPIVTTTVSGKYVIDGYYTEYTATNGDLNPLMNDDHYLVLGGTTTNYFITASNIQTVTGGMVTCLSDSALVFLLMLCLLSSPLMKLLQFLVPWLKKQITMINKFISKF